ncbi:MAG: hypothetical protein ACKO23_09550 [Gemmataceae bacterium]
MIGPEEKTFCTLASGAFDTDENKEDGAKKVAGKCEQFGSDEGSR